MLIKASTSNLVFPHQDIALDEKITGGKGASLADLYQAGHNVPDFFVISASAWRIIESLSNLSRFYDRLETLKSFQVRRISKISEQIRNAIRSIKLPNDLRQEIFNNARNQSEFNSWRSSMTGEDGDKLSYAGVLRTELFVSLSTPDDVDKILLSLLAEGFSVGAINYRIAHGVSHKISLQIVIQKQINSIAGIVFYGQSMTSTSESLFSVCYGQCEAIVANRVKTFRYKADNETLDIKLLSAGPQIEQLLPNFIEKNVAWYQIEENLQTVQPLPPEILKKIVEIGQMEKLRKGNARDIEISVTIEGGKYTIWMLQSRPVTKKLVTSKGPEDYETEILARGVPASPGVWFGKVSFIGSEPKAIPNGTIFLGQEFGPQSDWSLGSISAIIADTGDDASHGAAKGHEFSIPSVLGAENESRVPISELLKEGDEITVDGYYGIIYRGYSKIRVEWAEQKPPQQPINQAGLATKLVVNCSYVQNVVEAFQLGATGIGLLRGDFLCLRFLLSYIGGSENQAIEEISHKLSECAKPFFPMWKESEGKLGEVIYRTFGPKLHEMREKPGSEPWHNSILKDHRDPSAGIQGLSLSLHPEYIEAFILELQAFKKAWEQYPNLCLMFPVVRSLDDCEELLDILTEVGLNDEIRPRRLMMCELGINFTQPRRFLDFFDGASIGGNDSRLSLCLLNRDGMEGGFRYTPDDELLVATYCDFIRTAVSMGKTASFCGNLPSLHPEVCARFVQSGINSISVGVHALPAVEKIVRETEQVK